jgi:hypothetical protein
VARIPAKVTVGFAAFVFIALQLHGSAQTMVRVFEESIKQTGAYTIDASKVSKKKDVSGIERISDSACLIASDETAFVQTCSISMDGRAIHIEGKKASRVNLLPVDPGSELDIEALAAIDNTFYVMGSHSVSKKRGEVQKPRLTCFRFQVDPDTGERVGGVESASLDSILRGDGTLSRYYGKPLQRRGINIEGMAAKNGALFIGLRNPNIDGKAYVIEVQPDDLFGGEDVKNYTLHTVDLGAGLGIRAMSAIAHSDEYDGFFILAGNAGSEPGNEDYPATVTGIKDYDPNRGFDLHYWDGAGHCERIGEVARDDTSYKAEALLILKYDAAGVDILVLFDGASGGSPTEYHVRRAR